MGRIGLKKYRHWDVKTEEGKTNMLTDDSVTTDDTCL